MGSSTVAVDGDAMAYLGLPVLSCHDVGMLPPPRLNPKKKSKIKSMVLPTSVVLPIPMGLPVLIGGPPTISLMAMGMRAGMAGIGKGLKKLKGARKAKKAKKPRKPKKAQNGGCGKAGEPIAIVSGENVDEFVDYEVPGQIPLVWRRYYDSGLAEQGGPLGFGFRHEYQRTLRRERDGLVFVDGDGSIVEFERLLEVGEEAARSGLVLQRIADHRYTVGRGNAPRMVFHFAEEASQGRLTSLEDGPHGVDFDYDARGRLTRVFTSDHRQLDLSHDGADRISQVVLRGTAARPDVIIARYDYDDSGCLAQWIDAFGQRSRYRYDAANRMTTKTDRRGYSFRYEYDEHGRCIYTSGDGGLYEIWFEYRPEIRETLVQYADGGVWTYRYDDNDTIVEIVDPYGGVRTRVVGEDGTVLQDVDQDGNVTELVYDQFGGQIGRIDPLGHLSGPQEVDPNPPNPLEHDIAQTPFEWSWGRHLDYGDFGPLDQNNPVLRQLPPSVAARAREVLNWKATDGAPGATPYAGGDGAPREDAVISAPQVVQEHQARIRRKHDALGRLTEEVTGEGRRWWRYDPEGNVVQQGDRDGEVYQARYALWNMVAEEQDGSGRTASYRYSSTQEITRVVDAGGAASVYEYDQKDRLTKVHRHGVLREQYRYDANDNLVEKLDGQGNRLLRFEIGPARLPILRELASGEQHLFDYDERGRVTKASTGDFDVELAYDSEGQLTKDLRDGEGVVHETEGGFVSATRYFDRFEVNYEFDEGGSLNIIDPRGKSHRIWMDEAGVIVRKLSSGRAEVSQYSNKGACLGRIAWRESSDARGQSGMWSRRFEYSGEGDLRSSHDSDEGTTRYEFDRAHRLLRSCR